MITIGIKTGRDDVGRLRRVGAGLRAGGGVGENGNSFVAAKTVGQDLEGGLPQDGGPTFTTSQPRAKTLVFIGLANELDGGRIKFGNRNLYGI